MNLTGRPVAPKPPKPTKNPAHIQRVRQLPCCICSEYGEPQLSPTQAHHCIHGRYSQSKASDDKAIPLCEGHHQGLLDTSKVALHQHPTRWKRLYGEDHSWLPWVAERV